MLNIRRARQEDCQSIGSVHAAAVRGIRTALYTPDEIQAWAVPRKPESYEESIRSKEFLVAEEGGVIVGFGVLNQESAEVEAVYVSPGAGRRGIGLAVLRKLEERARASGLGMLRLNASLNAVAFYERAGYVVQEASKYRLHTGVEIACVPMVKAMASESDATMSSTIKGSMGELLIEVVSRAEAGDILCSPQRCADVICLVSIGDPHDELPLGFENVGRRLRLTFADHEDGEYGPTEEDVRRVIELAESLRSVAGKVLIHCEAGISRSSAAGLIMYAYWLGAGREREALERVLAQRPIAQPNRLMVSLADRLLGRGGRLVEALKCTQV
jgi:predicted protein tyrosine phosphatase/ribosomal protein S18 acetylase RimI-like enzyme